MFIAHIGSATGPLASDSGRRVCEMDHTLKTKMPARRVFEEGLRTVDNIVDRTTVGPAK